MAVAVDSIINNNKNPVHIADSAVVGVGGGVKSDDRSLLNWGDKSSKSTKLRSPNLEGFNETEYISQAHRDSDAYKLNGFNQGESDRLKNDRTVPDTRNHQ